MSNVQEGEVAIIGAGPVGLFTVFELGMLKIKAHVIDALDGPGGQCAALYPEKPIFDIPAHPEIMAAGLIEKLTEQAAPFDPVYHYGQQVVGLAQQPDRRWLLETSKQTRLLVKAVMIAGGVGAFGPNRPPLPGIECYEDAGPGLGVRYMVAQRENYRGKSIVIAGGGDSAVDWALSLADLAKKVYVVHRRPKFRAAPESVARLNQLADQGDVVEMVIPYQLRGLEGDGSLLEAVVVADMAGNERRLEADVLLPFFGLSMNLGPIADWGLELEHGHITVTPKTCQTNLEGIYAIGDIADYPGKLKLILCGFSEAAMAAHAVRAQLHPDEELHWEYSTTKGVPGE